MSPLYFGEPRSRVKGLPNQTVIRPASPSSETYASYSLTDVVSRGLKADPLTWEGTVNLHVVGKTGELLFASGILPAIRLALPRARICFHVFPHFLPVIRGLTLQPDEVKPSSDTGSGRFVDRVVGSLLSITHPGFILDGDSITTNLYRTHSWYPSKPRPASTGAPFYRKFMEAAGIPDGVFVKPSWGPLDAGPPVALVFPSGNAHSGLRSLQIPPDGWQKLADLAKAAGLLPIATAHPEDGKPVMKGWTWHETDDVTEILGLLTRARIVIGPNSGIVFAATQLSPGRVVMLDARKLPEYDFVPMFSEGVLDPVRHKQIRVTSKSDFYALLEEALS